MPLTPATRQHLYKVTADLPMCGCGYPEAAYQLVVDLLKLAPFYQHREDVARLVGPEDGGVYALVLGALDHAELIEHGGNISGSWITPKGNWFLQAVELAGGPDELSDATAEQGYPHNGGKCTVACWEKTP
jgi:hypothetical protein